MTFIEAAAYVLEREGRPLHSREIAEKAVDFGILSHVGKTPVQTMSARLSATVAKGRGKGPFVRIRPGVFGLSSWQGRPPGPAKPEPARAIKETETSQTAPGNDTKKTDPTAELNKEKKSTGPRPAPPRTPRTEETQHGDPNAPKKRKRRKRKVSHSSTPAASPLSGRSDSGEKTTSPAKEGAVKGKHIEGSATAKSPNAPLSKGTHSSSPFDKGGPRDSQEASTPIPKSVLQTAGSPSRPPHRAGDIVDNIEQILKRSTRPLPSNQLFEQIGLKGDNSHLLLDAMITADGFERAARGLRPRFVKYKNGYGLLEREISSEIIALEKQAVEARKRLVQIAEKQILKKLRSLPMNGFVRAMILFLQRSGFGAMVPIDLSRKNEFHLSVQDRRHQGRFRTAVVLRRDPVEHTIHQRSVMDLRGAIHHYDAMGGMILSTGQVAEAAVTEGRIANLPPVSLMDGETIAAEMARLSIGVKEREIKLPAFDENFFSTLDY